jgi:transcriptional regulator with XRE-family HTH domain
MRIVEGSERHLHRLMRIAEEFKAARLAKNLSINDVAKYGISPSMISDLEHAGKKPNPPLFLLAFLWKEVYEREFAELYTVCDIEGYIAEVLEKLER